MKLDRNSAGGQGKYALVNLRKISGQPTTAQELAAAILANPECVEFGAVGSREEFWVIKLKDINADAGLYAYAGKAIERDPEYAAEVAALARRAGPNSPFCKVPD